MIIVGAGNLGKLILDQMLMDRQISESESIIFFDEKTKEDKVFGKYPIENSFGKLKRMYECKAENYFVAIGNPRIRQHYDNILKKMNDFSPLVIASDLSRISQFSEIGNHLYLGYLSGIYHSCKIGYGNIIHSYVKVDHGVILGNFINISAGVTLLSDCSIGDFTFIGANAIILPNVKIGKNCYVTAGTIVRESMKDYETR